MLTKDEKEMFDVLAQQRQHHLMVSRVLKVVLPIMAFLLSVMCANLNWQSTVGTFVMLTVAFYAVGIHHLVLWHWLVLVIIYVFADQYFSIGSIQPNALRFQLVTMLVFVAIVGIGRPYVDRWLMKQPPSK